MRLRRLSLLLPLTLCQCHDLIGYNDFDEISSSAGRAGASGAQSGGQGGGGNSASSGTSGHGGAGQGPLGGKAGSQGGQAGAGQGGAAQAGAGQAGGGQGGAAGSGGDGQGGSSGAAGEASGSSSNAQAGGASGQSGASGSPGGSAGEAGQGGSSAGAASGAGQGGAGSAGEAGAAGSAGQAGGTAGQSGGSAGQGGGGAGGQGGSGAGGAGGQAGGPSISAVSVVDCKLKTPVPGKPLAQLPQGGSACVRITGSGFDAVSSASVGEIPLVALGVSSDSELTFGVEVPHGSTEGTRSVQLLVDGQPAGAPVPALDITALSLSSFGDDEQGLGTPSSPWATIQHTFSRALAGDTARMLSDLSVASESDIPWPQGVTLDGAGHSLNGSGMKYAPPEAALIKISSDAQVRDLTFLKFPLHALLVIDGVVTLTDVITRDCNTGMSVGSQARMLIHATAPGKCRFEQNKGHGLYIFNGPPISDQIVAEDCWFNDNGSSGIAVEYGGSVLLRRCRVEGNGIQDASAGGVNLRLAAALTSIDTDYKDNLSESILGLLTTDDQGNVSMPRLIDVQGGTIRGGLRGVRLFAAAQAVFRDVLIEDTKASGYHIEGPSAVTIEGTTPDGCVVQKTGDAALQAGPLLPYGSPTISLKDCALRDAPRGVTVAGPTSLSLSGVVLSGHKNEALSASNSGATLAVSGCSFSGNNTSADAALADVVLGRDGSGAAASFGSLSFDGQPYSGKGTLCGADATLMLGGKTRIRNNGVGCVAW